MNHSGDEKEGRVFVTMFRERAGHPMKENGQFESTSEQSSPQPRVFPKLRRQAKEKGMLEKNATAKVWCVDTNKTLTSSLDSPFAGTAHRGGSTIVND